MLSCNVIACSNCSLATTRPVNCPISNSLNNNVPTMVVGVTDIEDEDEYIHLGKASFESGRFDNVCFVKCGCNTGVANFSHFSIQRFSKLSQGDPNGFSNNHRECSTI